MIKARPPMPPIPAELQALAQVLGEAALLRLIETYGGTTIGVPTSPAGIARLGKVIGVGPAAALAEARAGGKLAVPLARVWRARRMFAEGASQTRIARHLQITESAVFKLLRSARDGAAQRSLFDAS